MSEARAADEWEEFWGTSPGYDEDKCPEIEKIDLMEGTVILQTADTVLVGLGDGRLLEIRGLSSVQKKAEKGAGEAVCRYVKRPPTQKRAVRNAPAESLEMDLGASYFRRFVTGGVVVDITYIPEGKRWLRRGQLRVADQGWASGYEQRFADFCGRCPSYLIPEKRKEFERKELCRLLGRPFHSDEDIAAAKNISEVITRVFYSGQAED